MGSLARPREGALGPLSPGTITPLQLLGESASLKASREDEGKVRAAEMWPMSPNRGSFPRNRKERQQPDAQSSPGAPHLNGWEAF